MVSLMDETRSSCVFLYVQRVVIDESNVTNDQPDGIFFPDFPVFFQKGSNRFIEPFTFI